MSSLANASCANFAYEDTLAAAAATAAATAAGATTALSNCCQTCGSMLVYWTLESLLPIYSYSMAPLNLLRPRALPRLRWPAPSCHRAPPLPGHVGEAWLSSLRTGGPICVAQLASQATCSAILQVLRKAPVHDCALPPHASALDPDRQLLQPSVSRSTV